MAQMSTVAARVQLSPAEALCEATRKGDIEQTTRLITSGADVNDRGPYDASPLSYVAGSGEGDYMLILAILIGARVDVNSVDLDEGETPLMEAASAGRLDAVKLLLKVGAKQSALNRDGESALSLAARWKQADIVEFLARESELNKKNSAGDSPLHVAAAQEQNVEVICNLIRAGADVGARNNEGMTAMHVAARNESSCNATFLSVWLLDSLDQADGEGLTPVDYAKQKDGGSPMYEFLCKTRENLLHCNVTLPAVLAE